MHLIEKRAKRNAFNKGPMYVLTIDVYLLFREKSYI